MEPKDILTNVQIELVQLRTKVEETLPHLATSADLAEIKLLIEQKLNTTVPTKTKIAINAALVTAITSAIMIIYQLIA